MLRMRKAAVFLIFAILILTVFPACNSVVTAYQPASTVDRHNESPTNGPTHTPWQTATHALTSTPTTSLATPASTTPLAVQQEATSATPTPQPKANPANWKNWPVIPLVSDKVKSLYQLGQQMGNNPHAFSKVGDCQNVPPFFLAHFEDPRLYSLGPYQNLKETIDYFKGSFGRQSVAVKGGFSIASVINPYPVDEGQCKKKETPVSCELRLNKPAFVVISLETWWSQRPASIYEGYLRQVVETAIAQGVVPILATKADNLEGDDSINRAIAQVASDYDVPLWNFWAAAHPLPSHGLTEDGFHLSGLAFPNSFDDANAMTGGWAWRNLTALQALDAVRKAIISSH